MAALAVLAALTAPAGAGWRVVGPGMAVGEARAGGASIAAECHGDGMVLGVYEKDWVFDHEAPLTLLVDDNAFTVRQYGSGDRILLADGTNGSGQLDLSPKLRKALRSGSEIRLDGPNVGHFETREITFSLLGSRKAIETVERFCE